MTDYERGFQQGEAVAWAQRHEPLPPKGQIVNERERGYWDGRLPRSEAWSIRKPSPLTWWGSHREAA